MLTNPRVGQSVTVVYGVKTRDIMPLHRKNGFVVMANRKRGGPRNHLVSIDVTRHVIPACNLRAGSGK
jgi:hypothetical protein